MTALPTANSDAIAQARADFECWLMMSVGSQEARQGRAIVDRLITELQVAWLLPPTPDPRQGHLFAGIDEPPEQKLFGFATGRVS